MTDKSLREMTPADCEEANFYNLALAIQQSLMLIEDKLDALLLRLVEKGKEDADN